MVARNRPTGWILKAMNQFFSGDPNRLFQQALALHRAGKLPEAVGLYRQLTDSFPPQPPLLNLLGTAELQLGQFEAGADHLAQSLRLNPHQPDSAANRGIALMKLNRPDEALAAFDLALSQNNRLVQTHNQRGKALAALGRNDEAEAAFATAATLKPDFAEAYYNRGTVLEKLDRPDEALAAFDRAIAITPDYLKARHNRANALLALQRAEEALTGFDQLIAEGLSTADIYNNRASALIALDRFDEALAATEQAITQDQTQPGPYTNRGLCQMYLGRYDDALASYQTALTRDPGFADAYWNMAHIRLLQGDFAAGLALFEWRWKVRPLCRIARHYDQPVWNGEDLHGKTVLVYAEQGLGDTIQFCRYLPHLITRGARLVFEVQKPLMGLMRTLTDDLTLTEQGTTPPTFDYHIALMSLPRLLRLTAQTIGPELPYLSADPEKCAYWKSKLGPRRTQRIGLVCSGSTSYRGADARRSIALEQFAPLFSRSCEFHLLQKEIRPADQATLGKWPQIQCHMADLTDFTDTAALAAQMDVVLSVDTSVAHLAGATGRPLWLLLPDVPDWRWQLERNDTLWYPTAKLFRQQRAGDWATVIEAVATAIDRNFTHA